MTMLSMMAAHAIADDNSSGEYSDALPVPTLAIRHSPCGMCSGFNLKRHSSLLSCSLLVNRVLSIVESKSIHWVNRTLCESKSCIYHYTWLLRMPLMGLRKESTHRKATVAVLHMIPEDTSAQATTDDDDLETSPSIIQIAFP